MKTIGWIIVILILSLGSSFLHAQEYSQIDSIRKAILQKEKTAPNSEALADLYLEIAKLQFYHDTALGVHYTQKALSIYEHKGVLVKQADACSILSKFYTLDSLYDIAVSYLLRTYKVFVELKDENAKAYTLSDIGNVFYAKRQYDIAMTYYERCKVIFSRTKDDFGLAVAYNNLALCQTELGHDKEAIRLFQLGLELRKKLNQPFLVVHSLNFIGSIYLKLQKITEAKQTFELAMDYYTKISQPTPEQAQQKLIVYRNLAECAHLEKDQSKAIAYLNTIFREANAPDDATLKSESYALLGTIYTEQNQPETALKAFLNSMQLAEKAKSHLQQWNALTMIIHTLQKMQRYDQTSQYWEIQLKLHDKIVKLMDRDDATRLYAAIETFNEERKTELLQRQKRMIFTGAGAAIVFLIIIVLLIYRQSRMNKQSSQQLENLSNSTFDGIFIHDDGIIVYVNEQMTRMTGYPLKELIGKSVLSLLQSDDLEASQEQLNQIVHKGKNHHHEIQIINKAGLTIETELFSQQFKYKGKLMHIAALRDISDRKRFIEVLVQSQNQLQELILTKDKLFSIIAHDLKNPFNAITGFSDLLIRDADSLSKAELREYAGYINEASQSAHDLLTNLLSWSRQQTGRLQYKPAFVALKSVSDRVMQLLMHQAVAKNIRLVDEVSPEFEVFADPEMLETILRNLISNAIKYTHEHGSVTLSAVLNSTGCGIRVTDTGIGMTDDTIGKLFKFDQMQSLPGTQNEGGTGLGLVLCEELVRKHNSTLKVISTIGEGTTFSFDLPVQQEITQSN